jgi:hypothetical protein
MRRIGAARTFRKRALALSSGIDLFEAARR